MSKRKKYFIIAVILFVVSVIYTLLVKTIDLKAIGPEESVVGFASLNGWFKDLVGVNDAWYKITKYLGIVPFLICAFYGLQGIVQLVKYKKLAKVDKRLIFLAILYVLMGVTYIFFEKVIINYRPVLEDGILEASFPSSHTMLAVCICASSLLISKYYIKNEQYRKIFDGITLFLMIFLTGGRALSGYHWLSDIIGGIIISAFLVALFYAFAYTPKKKL